MNARRKEVHRPELGQQVDRARGRGDYAGTWYLEGRGPGGRNR